MVTEIDELLLIGAVLVEEAKACELAWGAVEPPSPPQPVIVATQAESRSAFIIFIVFSRFMVGKSRGKILLKTTGRR